MQLGPGGGMVPVVELGGAILRSKPRAKSALLPALVVE